MYRMSYSKGQGQYLSGRPSRNGAGRRENSRARPGSEVVRQ